MPTPIDAGRVINGSFGEVAIDGEWQTNVTSVEATVEYNKEDVNRCGTRWVGHKVVGCNGTGTISGYHVTTTMMRAASAAALDDRSVPYNTEIITKLDDPEAFGAERVRLKNVNFDEVQLANFEAGALVEEEWPFTFEGMELLDEITPA